MKYISLFPLLAIVVALCIWAKLNHKPQKNLSNAELKALTNTGIKWNDTLMDHLPLNLDTSILVSDIHGNKLKFRDYIKPIFNHEAIVFQDKGIWRLHRLTQSAQDSLSKQDFAIARSERSQAYRTPDTIKNATEKLIDIAKTFNQADHILVFKGKRKMLVSKKGKLLFSLPIELGFKPTGNKITDGDGRTPEGTYHLDLKYNRGDKYYKSYWISYPNDNDKLIAQKRGVKAGSGIMIHGTTPGKTKAKDWTAGCIALQNKDIDSLFKYVADGTVIEIRK